MRRWIEWAVAAALLLPVTPSQAQSVAGSRRRCVQRERADAVRRDRQCQSRTHVSRPSAASPIEARHPAYMGTIVVDRSAPDFRNCDMSKDPVHQLHAAARDALRGFRVAIDWASRSEVSGGPMQVPVTAGRTDGDRIASPAIVDAVSASVPRRCWCFIPRTATGARARWRRRRISAGTPMARHF